MGKAARAELEAPLFRVRCDVQEVHSRRMPSGMAQFGGATESACEMANRVSDGCAITRHIAIGTSGAPHKDSGFNRLPLPLVMHDGQMVLVER